MSSSGYTTPESPRRGNESHSPRRDNRKSERSYSYCTSYTASDATKTPSPTAMSKKPTAAKKTKKTLKKKQPQKKKPHVPPLALPMDNTTKRMFSATNKTYRSLRSQKQELMAQFDDISTENDTLKRQVQIQQKELRLHQGMVDGVESILRQHAHEIEKVTRDQKEAKGACMRKERRMKQTEKGLDMANIELSRLKLLTDRDGSLAQADDLQEELSTVQNSLEEEKRKVHDLEKQTKGVVTENRKTCGSQRSKSKDVDGQIYDLIKQNKVLKQQIRYKDKEIAAKSMYRRREGHGNDPDVHIQSPTLEPGSISTKS